jgi:TfoX/Sxy family transcriptional regulator of competence genes
MAFDEELAGRIREVLSDVPNVTERRMFGGLAFLAGGHMACGIVDNDLMLRLGEEAADSALDLPHVRPMDFTGRPMRSMVYVDPEGVGSIDELRGWVRQALEFVATLPPKS